MEEPKNGATAHVPSPHTTPAPSFHTNLVPSPHITLISSPHHSPIPSVSAPPLKSCGFPIQIVDMGDEKSSSSESTKSNEVAKKTHELEKSQSSSRILS